MRVNLEHLESFVVLVEEGHFGRAATRLHVSSSALTKRMQHLESDLGVRLLERGPVGPAVPTREGRRLAADAGALLDHEAAVRGAAGGQLPGLVLGVPHDGGVGPVPVHRLSEVRRELDVTHPAELTCRRVPLPLMTSWLVEGRVDVLLTSGVVRHRLVHSTAVAAIRRVAAVAADSELGAAPEVRVEDMVDLPMLFDPSLPDEFMNPFYLGDLRPAAGANLVGIASRDARSVLRAVAGSTGVTVLPESLIPIRHRRLRVLPLVGAPPFPLYAARRAGDRRSGVRSLVRALSEVLSGADPVGAVTNESPGDHHEIPVLE